MTKMEPFSVSVFHCRRVVCACSAGAVGSFSNKPLSPKWSAVGVGLDSLRALKTTDARYSVRSVQHRGDELRARRDHRLAGKAFRR